MSLEGNLGYSDKCAIWVIHVTWMLCNVTLRVTLLTHSQAPAWECSLGSSSFQYSEARASTSRLPIWRLGTSAMARRDSFHVCGSNPNVVYDVSLIHPTRSNDSTRFRKACISTTQKTLRENTCTIASGDYSTPVSQRLKSSNVSVGVATPDQHRVSLYNFEEDL